MCGTFIIYSEYTIERMPKMIVYKITNLINNKVYIGQTVNSLEQRFNRHKQDALSGRLDTHFARALRKYGTENFVAEIIDTAESQEELTQKEYYWIGYYHACEDGYNESNSMFKCGGNTYAHKNELEMRKISSKIRESKIGGKNPASKKIKCKNITTNEELFFDSLAECQRFFGETNHNFITRRCLGKTKCLYKKEWAFAYAEDSYRNFSKEKGSTRAQPIRVYNLDTKEQHDFPSYTAAEKFYHTSPHAFSDKAYKYDKIFTVGQYQITKIN